MSPGPTRRATLLLARIVCGLEIPPREPTAIAELVALAHHYDVTTTLAERLLHHGAIAAVPDTVLDHLMTMGRSAATSVEPAVFAQVARKASRAHTGSLMAAMEQAAAALRDAGVDVVPMKGAHVLRRGWLRTDQRSMRDLDLLVAPQDARTATEVLRSIGFEPIDPRLPDGRMLRAEHHLTPMCRAGTSGSVELHTDALPRRWRSTLPTDAVWAAASPSGSVLLMDDDVAVVHVLLHALGSDAAHRSRAIPMRALVDVAARMHRTDLAPLDWAAIEDRFARGGHGALFAGFRSVATRVGLAGMGAGAPARRYGAVAFALSGRPRLATALNTNARRVALLGADTVGDRKRFVAAWLARKLRRNPGSAG